MIDVNSIYNKYNTSEQGLKSFEAQKRLEENGRNYPIRIHSQNPVGVQNMRAIIHRNGWKEIF